jgi:hypothetical protein
MSASDDGPIPKPEDDKKLRSAYVYIDAYTVTPMLQKPVGRTVFG